MTKISTKAIEANNIEATEVAAMNAANETEALPCCPKGKTTVLAVIEGKERDHSCSNHLQHGGVEEESGKDS
jgi:hypothetical protein